LFLRHPLAQHHILPTPHVGHIQPLAFEFDLFDRFLAILAFALKHAADFHPAYFGELQLVFAEEAFLGRGKRADDQL
jgi:hypothetical protein